MRNVWLLVTDKKNWDVSKNHYTFGIQTSPGRIKSLNEEDLYVVYITRPGCFAGWGYIRSNYVIDKQIIWEDRLYPYRFKISYPQLSDRVVPAVSLKDKLEFITDKKKWMVHFRNGVQLISEHDYFTIVEALRGSTLGLNQIKESKLAAKFQKSKRDIGNKLHDRIEKLFEKMGFTILKSDYNASGPDVIVQDPATKGNTKIIIQCKRTEKKGSIFNSLDDIIHEYSSRLADQYASCAIIVLSGYELSSRLDPLEILKTKRVAIWSDVLIDYYEDLTSKIGGYARYQLFSDLGMYLKFDSELRVKALEITQGKEKNKKFYIFGVNPEWLIQSAAVIRRLNFGKAVKGYQRLLNKRRIKREIPDFLDQEDWLLPNSIICATRPDTTLKFEGGYLTLPSRYGALWVMDGQHRLYGFANTTSKIRRESELVCTLFDSASMGDDVEARQAGIFVNLNLHAKKVDKSLLLELYELLDIKDPAVTVVMKLAQERVFKDSISGYSQRGGSISLTTFATNQAMKTIVSTESPILKVHPKTKAKVNELFFSILFEYFNIVAKVFEEEWIKSDDYVLKTDRGIRGLLRLFIKILEYDEYKQSKSLKVIEKVLRALKGSNFDFRIESLRGKYNGESGAKQLLKEWSILINKEIPGFEPTVRAEIIDRVSSSLGNIDDDAIKRWFKMLEGDIRARLMYIDNTTFKFLRFLDQTKINSIKVFFGSAGVGGFKDMEKIVKDELKKMREEGYNITLTKATKRLGAYWHARWIASNKYQVDLETDLKERARESSAYDLKLVKWDNSPEILEFDQDWEQASRGINFEYNWGSE